jgi:integrase
MPGRDTRTRWEGVYARHQEGCGVEELARGATLDEIARACDCDASYYGKGYDPETKRHLSTKRFKVPSQAKKARRTLLDLLEKGGLPREASLRLRDALPMFVEDMKAGRALNKHGKAYKPKAIKTIEQTVGGHVVPTLGKRRIGAIRKGEIQRIADNVSENHSGSTVRNVVNSVRALYTWAKQRELASHKPADEIVLPPVEEKPRERIATPKEMVALLGALERKDAVPYALAVYSWARSAQIQYVLWKEVDLKVGLIEWGADEENARKSEAAKHVVPLLKPVWTLLREAWIEQGRPDGEQLVCPPINKKSKSGLLSMRGVADRAAKAWEEHDPKLQPIGLQECRHTAASWLDPAGVSPKTSSILMGHSIPDRQPGAAPITLVRYTHLMPEALEIARKQMDEWILAQIARETEAELVAAGEE